MRHGHTFNFRGMTLRDALNLLNEEELYKLYYILGSAGKSKNTMRAASLSTSMTFHPTRNMCSS